MIHLMCPFPFTKKIKTKIKMTTGMYVSEIWVLLHPNFLLMLTVGCAE